MNSVIATTSTLELSPSDLLNGEDQTYQNKPGGESLPRLTSSMSSSGCLTSSTNPSFLALAITEASIFGFSIPPTTTVLAGLHLNQLVKKIMAWISTLRN